MKITMEFKNWEEVQEFALGVVGSMVDIVPEPEQKSLVFTARDEMMAAVREAEAAKQPVYESGKIAIFSPVDQTGDLAPIVEPVQPIRIRQVELPK